MNPSVRYVTHPPAGVAPTSANLLGGTSGTCSASRWSLASLPRSHGVDDRRREDVVIVRGEEPSLAVLRSADLWPFWRAARDPRITAPCARACLEERAFVRCWRNADVSW